MSVMGQSVEGGIGHDRIGKKGQPVLGRPVACNDDGRPEIALRDYLVEVFRLKRVQSGQTEIVDDEQIRSEVFFHSLLPGLIGPSCQQEAQELHSLCKQDIIAEAAGMVTDDLGDVSFSNAGGAAQKHVLVLFDKSAPAQVPDHLGADPGVEGEIEPFKSLFFFETGPGNAQIELFGLPAFHLVLQEKLEELQISQGVLLGLLKSQIEALEKAAQAQRSQLFLELVVEVHGITSAIQSL